MVDPALLAGLIDTGHCLCFICHERIAKGAEWAIGVDKRGDERPMHKDCDG